MVRYRVAVALCLLLVLHEFGPAHFARIKPPAGESLDQVVEEPETKEQEPESDLQGDNNDDNVEDEDNQKEHENKEHQEGSRRGFGSVLTNVIKVAKAGNEIIPKMVVLASIGNTVFRAVAGCCADYPKACEGNEEISNLRTNISIKSDELDAIQLEAKNLQDWTESTSDEFATVLFKLNAIVENSELLVKEMSPAVKEAINRQTTQIKKLVRKNKESGKELGLLEVQKMYDSAIKTALGIVIPVITVVIPTIPKMVKFVETKMGLRNSYTLEENIPLKKPTVSNSKALKSWLGKTKVKIDERLDAFKTKLNTKYGGAIKVMKNIGSGLTLIFGYIGSAYGIYNIVASAQSCKEKEKKVTEALNEYRKVDKELTEAIAKAKEAKQLVQEAWENMRKDLISSEFIDDLKETKAVIASLATQSKELKTAEQKVQEYIEKAGEMDGYEMLYEITRELSEGLGTIPFTIGCYRSKARMARNILDNCKAGTDAFQVLYRNEIEKTDTDADKCESKIGYTHIQETAIKKGLAELAMKENFEEDCVLNSESRKSLACIYKEQKFSNDEIVEKVDGLSSVEQVKFLTKNCQVPITPIQKEQVCNFKKIKETKFTDEMIAKVLELKLQDVKAVKC